MLLVLVGFKRSHIHTTVKEMQTSTTALPDSCPDCTISNKANQSKSKPTAAVPKTTMYPSLLIQNCNGFETAIITQASTPVKTQLHFDGEKGAIEVKENIFNTFIKNNPFSNTSLDTCAVVGNGGILTNSSCGEAIDSAQFVIRCNLPPLDHNYSKHVGNKTHFVTANPSIFRKKYRSLKNHPRQFAEDVSIYRDSFLVLPAFSFQLNFDLCLRAVDTLKAFSSSVKPVFINPVYLKKLDKFWHSVGLNPCRLSTGFMMVSLALEVCKSVDVFGFWPFNYHPDSNEALSNHYYDDQKPLSDFHKMPEEFAVLQKMHSQGVLRLHLGECDH
ncbi:hypothetical protein WMY93_003399 [Mugilogobius chulae]|uniref:ST8 alpha-N-acetyl-neuraminide alpha-2,8-sialyltransferase 6 n=1 Tax=Mugilogobius chulae TaxID=88201 RepID=A0AAW0PWK3_9GOBI